MFRISQFMQEIVRQPTAARPRAQSARARW